jgi:hypothetical protein
MNLKFHHVLDGGSTEVVYFEHPSDTDHIICEVNRDKQMVASGCVSKDDFRKMVNILIPVDVNRAEFGQLPYREKHPAGFKAATDLDKPKSVA